jgi:hypothetical protein
VISELNRENSATLGRLESVGMVGEAIPILAARLRAG